MSSDTVIVHQGEKLVLRDGRDRYTIRKVGDYILVSSLVLPVKLCEETDCTIKISVTLFQPIEVTNLGNGAIKVKWNNNFFTGLRME